MMIIESDNDIGLSIIFSKFGILIRKAGHRRYQKPGIVDTKNLASSIPKTWYRRYRKLGIVDTESLVSSIPKTWYHLYQKLGIDDTKRID